MQFYSAHSFTYLKFKLIFKLINIIRDEHAYLIELWVKEPHLNSHFNKEKWMFYDPDIIAL